MSALRRSTRNKTQRLNTEVQRLIERRGSSQPGKTNDSPHSPSPQTKTMDTTSPEVKGQSAAAIPAKGIWSHYDELCQRLPGRQTQIELLLTLCGELSSPTTSPLYLYGNTGTGKTLTIKTLLKMIQAPHCIINCVECYNPRVLFECILSHLSNQTSQLARNWDRLPARCDSVCGFVRALQQLLRGNKDTVYIVLDKAERLRELDVTVLPAMMRLKELSGCEVCVVMVSELPVQKLSTDTVSTSCVLPVHFTDYTKAETLAIMALDRDPEDSVEFYATFSNHIWNVFNIVCRDLGELRHLSAVLYPKYREPVVDDLIGSHETRRLWKHIEPFFKDVMSRIYLRELSTNQGERALATPTNSFGGMTDYLELPYYSKYLLLSSFLASYNPARADRRFFSKTKQPRARKSHKQSLKEKPNHQLLGPKPFPLDRLMAIFYSILEEDVPPAAHLYSQVASLVTLQLLTQVSSGDSLDAPKYKCLLILDSIRMVARSVGFDIVQYLYDFN